jgi:hypothetical protein
MIRLRKTEVRYYRGRLNYVVALDGNAGKLNVYTVYVLNSGDPATIGRELPLVDVKKLIADYERVAPKFWIGDRGTVDECMEHVNERRRRR